MPRAGHKNLPYHFQYCSYTPDDSVCYFISKNMLPYHTVNDPGFCAMLSAFDPRYVPMDQKILAILITLQSSMTEKESECAASYLMYATMY